MSYLQLFSSPEQNRLGNFGRGPYEEHLCEIDLKWAQWFRKRCHLKKKFTDDGQCRVQARKIPITKAYLT